MPEQKRGRGRPAGQPAQQRRPGEYSTNPSTLRVRRHIANKSPAALKLHLARKNLAQAMKRAGDKLRKSEEWTNAGEEERLRLKEKLEAEVGDRL